MTPTSTTRGRVDTYVEGGIGWIVLANSAKRNAMTPAMWDSIPLAVARLSNEPSVRVIVLSGAEGTFCAGADIVELDHLRTADAATNATVLAEMALVECNRPTIALIQGFCIGGGCQLALACDMRISTPDALFGITPAKLGIVYPHTSIRRLVAAVGPSTAKLLLYTSELFSADRAQSMRLIDEVVDRPHNWITRFTETIARRSPLSIAASKELIELSASSREMWLAEEKWNERSQHSGEAAEGIAAFLEKRDPIFDFRFRTWGG